jgi:hypothetical protein
MSDDLMRIVGVEPQEEIAGARLAIRTTADARILALLDTTWRE